MLRRTCTTWEDGIALGELYIHVRFRDDTDGPSWVMSVDADTTTSIEEATAVVRRLFLSRG